MDIGIPTRWHGVAELRPDVPILEHYFTDEPAPPYEPDFEALIERAFLLAQEVDRISWKLGDMLNILLADVKQGRPAEQRLTRSYIAGRLQLSTSKVEDLQKVASRFPASVRGDIPPNLGIAHLRTIARRVEDLPAAMEWVEMAAANDWTVDKLAFELGQANPSEPKPPVAAPERHMIAVADLAELLKGWRHSKLILRPVDLTEHEDYYLLKVYK